MITRCKRISVIEKYSENWADGTGVTISAAAVGVAARASATKSAIVKSISCPTAEIIGKRVLGIQVGRRKDLPKDWAQPQGEDWKTQETLIAYLMFQLEGGVGLAFEPFNETGRVFLIDRDKKIRTISLEELRPALTLAPLIPDEEESSEE